MNMTQTHQKSTFQSYVLLDLLTVAGAMTMLLQARALELEASAMKHEALRALHWL